MLKRKNVLLVFSVFLIALSVSFRMGDAGMAYAEHYQKTLKQLLAEQNKLLLALKAMPQVLISEKEQLKLKIKDQRLLMKGLDFWLRYLEPTTYKKINGPLPVEWETEVFEKFEKPYRREGAGYTLAWQYLEEEQTLKDSLEHLIQSAQYGTRIFLNDSILNKLNDPSHFYFCNRLFLLNLSAIYTTGFDCPDPESILPELDAALSAVYTIYRAYNTTYPGFQLSTVYLEKYLRLMDFVKSNHNDYGRFDHFTFIKDFVNPLYALNQQHIREYKLSSKSVVDYSLNKNTNSIFDKSLYLAQNPKGLYRRISDPRVLAELERLGKLLFYDPILSFNNQRACASCHKSEQAFTDTLLKTHLQLNTKEFLNRNSPSLLNSMYNHLIMLDGKHLSLQEQVKAVISNSIEMGETPDNALKKVLNCKEYKIGFKALLKYTPEEKELSFDHLSSAITYYYSKFSKHTSAFDRAMNKQDTIGAEVKAGFILFMGKAQCATCHFVPHFNGVKPPYVGSEFEVLGVPADSNYTKLSADVGRYGVNPAPETQNAFRTGSLRNIARTKPYMHNGVFTSLEQVVDFYNAGGGAGRGLSVPNQTLSSDSLNLDANEKYLLVQFMKALNENTVFETPPDKLPISRNTSLNTRLVGGSY
jgi:cytochrome c peroxidase